MVIASHAVFAAYGFWLPNDGRGSWSTEVWAPHLRRFGPATKTSERQSLARRPHDRASRLEAKENLKYPAVQFTGAQARVIALAFAEILRVLDLPAYACAVMPDHSHLVLPRHSETIEQVVGFLKRAASRKLREAGIHPMQDYPDDDGSLHTPWVIGGWNRFLHDDAEIAGAIDYVEKNPTKAGLPRQHWQFISPYRGVWQGVAWPRRLSDQWSPFDEHA
jgi:REP element-mobilizing transposase RayT